jgi:hypothetical protein
MSDSTRRGAADLRRRKALGYLGLSIGLAAVGLVAPRRALACYCGCSVSGCNCCGFMDPPSGQPDLCGNCGHHYSDHGGHTCGGSAGS